VHQLLQRVSGLRVSDVLQDDGVVVVELEEEEEEVVV